MAAENYITRTGDTWDMIAYSLFGDETQMTALIQANRDYVGVLVFDAGVVLTLPEIETIAPMRLPPWQT